MSSGERPPAELRVLLVDDDHVVRHVLADAMTRKGLVVDEAGDGDEALIHLTASRPDAIVTDLQMPRLDGNELCRRVKSDPATREIPVIVVTGSSVDDRDVLAMGCDRLMTKPVTPLEMIAAVTAIVADRSGERQLSGARRAVGRRVGPWSQRY